MKQFDDMIRGLQKEIQVPESVWNQYTHTLSHLPEKTVPKKSSAFTGKKIWPSAAVIALFLGTATVSGAVYHYWNGGLKEKFQISSELNKKLEENHMKSFLDQSVTQDGVTVTAQESIVDQYFAHLSFQVEGYALEEGKQPAFSETRVQINQDSHFPVTWTSSFYQGLISGSGGQVLYADNTPVTSKQISSYYKEDGTMEFQITLMSEEKGAFLNQPIHIELKDLGFYTEDESVQTEAKGTWSFDWILKGCEEIKTYTLNTFFEETGTTLLQAELSPISISCLYRSSEENITDGKTLPAFTGVRLKDGTLLTGLSGQGYSGYPTENSDVYRDTFALERVVDTEQVESLLFVRSASEGQEALTEENLYIVPVS